MFKDIIYFIENEYPKILISIAVIFMILIALNYFNKDKYATYLVIAITLLTSAFTYYIFFFMNNYGVAMNKVQHFSTSILGPTFLVFTTVLSLLLVLNFIAERISATYL